MRNMKGKTESVHLGLEVLTPVQTGSGLNLTKNLDYIEHGGKVFVVDQERTFEKIAAGDAVLDSVLSGSRLDDLVSLAGQPIGYTLPFLAGSAAVPGEFREQLKDAFLRPYIPGTAIKGAIRTALFAKQLRELPESSYRGELPRWDDRNKRATAAAKMAAKALTEKVFGRTPNKDLLRALHVGDAIYRSEDLRLDDIRWMNVVKSGDRLKAKWRRINLFDPKDDKPFKNQEKWEDANGIHAEMLTSQAMAPAVVQWDEFLLSDMRWHSDNPMPNLLPRNFTDLRDALNEHARFRLERECEFYRQFGQSQPGEQCQRLLDLLNKETNAAYLQLSWGSGWRGMTGDWMSDDAKENMRSIYREMKGREGMPFPKTRRLAVANGLPCLPLGWIRLIPHDQVANRLAELAEKQQQQASRCTWVDETVQEIMAKHRAKEDDALRGKALADAWSQIVDEDLKRAALKDIKSRWQEKGWWGANLSGSAKKASTIYQTGSSPSVE